MLGRVSQAAQMQDGAGMLASTWLTAFEQNEPAARRALEQTYGTDPAVLNERLILWRSVLMHHRRRFGDERVRLFRSPGRINLRGMHVDTHGGYLNLMTHQREVVTVVSSHEDPRMVFSNVASRYDDVEFSAQDEANHSSFTEPWLRFITDPEIQGQTLTRRGHWGNYLRGCVLRVCHQSPEAQTRGIHATVGSDLTTGAALSSSTALSTAVLVSVLGVNGQHLDDASLILAVKDAEWYTGARGGTSDQAAMILGACGQLVNIALLASDLDTSQAIRVPFPSDLEVLVIDSFTERSLSGANVVDYTRNRFAYSLAMEIVRQEMQSDGWAPDIVNRLDRLPRLSPDELGGLQALYHLLRRIPETISLADLRSRYDLPNLDAAYEQYFGTVPEEVRPLEIGLRGPLLFGIAESERARVFIETLRDRDFIAAGRLMTIGHDGDRRRSADGHEFHYDAGDNALERMARENLPIRWCPGIYGASSPVLDTLVDTALEAGALGASLTGAGIAGSVLALCRAEDAGIVAQAIREQMATPAYAGLAGRTEPPNEDEIQRAVAYNRATGAAGELRI